jgi:hypothetical protein
MTGCTTRMRSSEFSVEFHDRKCSFSTSSSTPGGGTAVKAGTKVELVNGDADAVGLAEGVGEGDE